MRKAHFTEHQIIAVIKSVEVGRTVKDVCQEAWYLWSHLLHLWTTSVLQVLNLVLSCCLHLSGIRKICAQMGNPHTIASTTGRPLGQYNSQVPIVQVQPVTISQYAATFAGRGLISHYLILGLISQHRPDYSRILVNDHHDRFIKSAPFL